VFPANPLTARLGFLGLREHSVSSGSLRRIVVHHLETEDLGDALIDLHVVAADVMTGEDVLLSAGSVPDAVPARRFGQSAVPVGASGWVG
jgi:NTE family protein